MTPLAYKLRGAGPEVLFIQGVGVHGDGWRPQIDALASRFACLSFDNRGMGASPAPNGKLSVEGMADDAASVMDAVGWRAAHVVGHSLGGVIAQQLALAHPERVRSLALLCTFGSGKHVAPLTARMMWYGMRSRIGTRRMRRHGFLGLVMPPPAPTGAHADELARKLESIFGHDLADQPAVVEQQLAALRAAELIPKLAQVRVPTLVVSARHDPIAPPSAGRALAAAIQGARLVEVEDASHGLPITHAARVNELLEQHFQMRSETT